MTGCKSVITVRPKQQAVRIRHPRVLLKYWKYFLLFLEDLHDGVEAAFWSVQVAGDLGPLHLLGEAGGVRAKQGNMSPTDTCNQNVKLRKKARRHLLMTPIIFSGQVWKMSNAFGTYLSVRITRIAVAGPDCCTESRDKQVHCLTRFRLDWWKVRAMTNQKRKKIQCRLF